MKICPVCEGLTSSDVARCSTCDVQLVTTNEMAWVSRDGDEHAGSPWIGVVLGGKYRITGVLGKGGMGTVFRAVHELSLSVLAVKVLHPRFARHPQFKSSLVDEARKASLLRSEHAARIVDVGETPEGSVFVAMELAHGETLDVWLSRRGRLPGHVVIELLVQLCDALEQAEHEGLVHRDLSPRNIMVEAREGGFRAQILDFGIAMHRGSGQDRSGHGRSREGGSGEGTSREGASAAADWVHPPYTAPEILRDRPYDSRADLFSLGVLALECLNGEPPFQPRGRGATLDDRIEAVLDGEAEFPSARFAPPVLRRVLPRLVEKDPSARLASARSLRETLEASRAPRSSWLQVLAVLVFIAGSTGLLTAFVAKSSVLPFLQSNSASALELVPDRSDSVKLQCVPRERVERVAFVASGIERDGLVARGFVGDRMVFEYGLAARVRGASLELDAARDPSWKAILDIAGREAVNIDFHVRRSNRRVAHARLLVDTQVPRIDVSELEAVLSLTTELEARVEDDTRVESLHFELRDRVGAGTGRVLASLRATPSAAGVVSLPLGAELAKSFARGVSRDAGAACSLRCKVVDRAGRSSIWTHEFRARDLEVPRVTALEGAGGRDPILLDEGVARMLVTLSRAEASPQALRVRCTSAGELVVKVLKSSDFELRGDKLLFAWSFAQTSSVADFSLVFVDSAGNASPSFARSLRFVDLEVEGRFRLPKLGPEAGARPALLQAKSGTSPWRLIVASGAAVTVEYSCNPEWTPQAGIDGSAPLRVTNARAGGCTVALPMLAAGERRVLRMKHARGSEESEEALRSVTSLEVIAMPDPPRIDAALRLRAGVFLAQLASEGLLEHSRDSVRLDIDLSPAPTAASALRARYCVERGGRWVPQPEWTPIAEREDLAKLVAPLRFGRNRIALQVVDRLGRPAGRGSVDARVLVAGGGEASFVAEFWHAEPIATDPIARVEFGRAAVVRALDEAPVPVESTAALVHGLRSFPGMIRMRQRALREYAFEIPFDVARAICSWRAGEREAFAREGPKDVDFVLRTVAGDRPMTVRFSPTRSLLRGLDLSQFDVRRSTIQDMRFVPFLSPGRDARIALGPALGARARGSVTIDPPLFVSAVDAYYLGAQEVSRRSWKDFIDDVVERAKAADFEWAELGHREDPLGARRFTRAALMPDLSLFGAESSFEDVVRAAPDRPISGVNYYQAAAFCRWLGLVAFGDPDVFRLPFGVELEWAAIGPALRDGAVNGVDVSARSAVATWRRDFLDFRRRAKRGARIDAARWPANAAECIRLGDSASAWDGSRVHGLEFGVREWVEDLPVIGASTSFRLLVETHGRHVEYTRRRRVDEFLSPRRASALAMGQLRGLSWGEPEYGGFDPVRELVDVGADQDAKSILGVKRIRYVRREGSGIAPGQVAQLVRIAGFRVAGGAAFIRIVRRRTR